MFRGGRVAAAVAARCAADVCVLLLKETTPKRPLLRDGQNPVQDCGGRGLRVSAVSLVAVQ